MEKIIKGVVIIFSLIFACFLVIAQSNKIEVSTAKDIFDAGEKITFRVSLYDSQNNPVNDNVGVVIEDAEKLKKIEKIVPSNQFVDVDLGEGATYGYWTITAKYGDSEAKGIFSIEVNELAQFILENNVLTIKNIGNTKYTKTVQIIIGDTAGTKEPSLNVGEEISYRLIAPQGTYNVKITDGQTSLTRDDVALTGNAIGILDERVSQGPSFTGAIRPEDEEDSYIFSNRNKLPYVLIFVLAGGGVLIAIEKFTIKQIINPGW